MDDLRLLKLAEVEALVNFEYLFGEGLAVLSEKSFIKDNGAILVDYVCRCGVSISHHYVNYFEHVIYALAYLSFLPVLFVLREVRYQVV